MGHGAVRYARTHSGLLGRCVALALALSVALPPWINDVAAASEPGPPTSPGSVTAVRGIDDGDVAIILSGAGARSRGWSTVPVTAHLVARRPGQVWYRWGPAPGRWNRSTGPIVCPEGKQLLSAVLVSPDGLAGPVVTETVRSDFTVPPSALTVAGEFPEATASAIAAAPVSGQVDVLVTVRTVSGTSVRRVGGRDRYDVAAGVSSGFSAADTVIVASGEKFPDALTASGLAGCLGSPLLLTRRTTLPASAVSEIQRLGAKKAIVCGGPATVDSAVLRRLAQLGLTVERIDGRDRFEVAANTARRIRQLGGGSGRALIARGDIYPDALSLGPVAYARKEPILLVLPGSLPQATRSALAGGYTSAAIAGGTASVSPGVASQIAGVVGPTVRWGGADRYQAAVTIASAGVAGGGNAWSYVAVAKGTDFADALTGGTGAGRRGGVLLLTTPQPLSRVTDAALTAQAGQVRAVDVMGGTASVTPQTYERIRAIFQ